MKEMELLVLVKSSKVKFNNRRLLTSQSVLLYLALAAFVLAVLIPFYWLVKASVSTPEQLVEIPSESSVPDEPAHA